VVVGTGLGAGRHRIARYRGLRPHGCPSTEGGYDVLLERKNAVIYGGGGAVGGAVARAFAREGAKVFLAGRTLATLDRVAEEIAGTGGQVETAEVDALDEASVDRHADAVAERAGRIDVSFNTISHGDIHGVPVLEMPFDDFARPVTTALRSQYLTARAAAGHMEPAGSGVILAITATTAQHAIPEVGGTAVAFDAIESMCRQLAAELGPKGIRVVWLRTTGLPEAILDDGSLFPAYGTDHPGGMTREQLIAWIRAKTMLGRLTSLAEVANMAAFMASDLASATTAAGANLTCGSVPTR
jgi:NAD(P)-dependent dehydrogenase (short-subunit alcohol dehydrogenase family)